MNDLNLDLIAAAWRNDVEEAARLIELGADVNAKDDTAQSAYLIATSEGYLDLLDLTLEHGGDVDSRDSYNGTGLIRAADRGHADIIGSLLRAGIAVDHINNLGWTALHEAIILGDGSQRYVDCVRLLLACGADPSLVSRRDNISPLQHAESRRFQTIVTTLRTVIDADCPVDANAALLAAAASADTDAATVALRAGADPAVTDDQGRTALEISTSAGSDDVARLLRLLVGE